MNFRIRSNFWAFLSIAAVLWLPLLSASCSASKAKGVDSILTGRSDIRDPRIPSLAYGLKRAVRAEVNYYWGLEQRATIFYSQIHQESTWRPDAVSPVGAQGLSQFMPATAEWVSKLYPKDLGGEANPLDARWAIRSCILFDKFLFNIFKDAYDEDNRWRFTLSSYNGGEGNTNKDKRLAMANGKSSNKWTCNVEHYSGRSASNFKENRNYVKRILDQFAPMYRIAGFV
jgi:soluble lytic murein transglycosylase-like protein